MGKSKLQIPKICVYCGNTFLAKTIKTMYCSRKCAWSACNEKRKQERGQKMLNLIKASGRNYITITEALLIFITSRNTVHRLIRSKAIRCIRISPKRVLVCVNDLETLFPLKPEKLVIVKKKRSLVFDMDPERCYTIGEITKRFKVTERSVYKHIRQYSIPIRQVGNYVYAPKAEIDKLYNNKNTRQ